MKKPSILTLVNRILRKLKAKPDNYGINFPYRNPLVESAARLMETVPEEARISERFKKNAQSLFREVFSGRNHSHNLMRPFFPHLGQDFIDNEILNNRDVWDDEKAEYVSQERLYAFYETQSLTNLDFRIHYGERRAIVKWFKQLPKEKQKHILLTRLHLAADKVNIAEIMEYSEDSEVLRLTAEKIEKNKSWRAVFPDNDLFDPQSTKGKERESLANYLHPDLWILHEISSVESATGDVKEMITLIKQYFGEVSPPQSELKILIAEALSRGEVTRVHFLSSFLV